MAASVEGRLIAKPTGYRVKTTSTEKKRNPSEQSNWYFFNTYSYGARHRHSD